MSIKPEYATAILKGQKRYEFRRSIFKKDVGVIVIYATSPVQRVVGEFDVCGIMRDAVSDLWARTKSAAGIEHAQFFRYFEGKDAGYAIKVGDVRLFEEPLDLERHFGIRPPQSFRYLDFPWPLSRE